MASSVLLVVAGRAFAISWFTRACGATVRGPALRRTRRRARRRTGRVPRTRAVGDRSRPCAGRRRGSSRGTEAVRATTTCSWPSSRLGLTVEPADEIGRHLVAVRLVEHLVARALVADHGDIPDAGVAVALRDQFHERHR